MGAPDIIAVVIITVGALLVATVLTLIFRFNPFMFVARKFKGLKGHDKR